MPAQDNVRLVQDLFDAVNRHDVDGALSLVDPNVEWVNMATGETFRGPGGFRRILQEWWRTFPDNSVEIVDLIAGQDGATVEYIGKGTHDGPLTGPSGEISPTGRHVEMQFCDVYKIKNGKIVSGHIYYDLETLMRQLGQAPMTRQAGA